MITAVSSENLGTPGSSRSHRRDTRAVMSWKREVGSVIWLVSWIGPWRLQGKEFMVTVVKRDRRCQRQDGTEENNMQRRGNTEGLSSGDHPCVSILRIFGQSRTQRSGSMLRNQHQTVLRARTGTPQPEQLHLWLVIETAANTHSSKSPHRPRDSAR